MSNLDELKVKLNYDITERVDHIVNDCRTFVYAKSKIRKLKKNSWGGGNFLCCSGTLTVLNLLAKINNVLNGGKIFTQSDVGIQKEEISTYKENHPDDKKLLKNLTPSYANTPHLDETQCFVELWKDTSFIRWGFENEKFAKRFWRDCRNSLAHLAQPRIGIAAASPDRFNNITARSYLQNRKWEKESIYGPNGIDNNGNVVNAIAIEMLWEQLPFINYYIKKKINECDKIETLENVEVILQ